MNKEFPKEMKITPGGEEACARMRLLLKRAQDTIERALRDDSFLLTPGRLPWRLVQPTRRSRSGVVYDADGRAGLSHLTPEAAAEAWNLRRLP